MAAFVPSPKSREEEEETVPTFAHAYLDRIDSPLLFSLLFLWIYSEITKGYKQNYFNHRKRNILLIKPDNQIEISHSDSSGDTVHTHAPEQWSSAGQSRGGPAD